MTAKAEAPVYLDAILRPNPPMAARTLLIVLVIVGALNFAFGLSFVLRGAWPVMPFMGADVGLLAWAFFASRRAARRFEHVVVTHEELAIERHPVKGAPDEITFNPYWVQVRVETQEEDEARHLMVGSHGKFLQLGSFLSPRDRFSFAQKLKGALSRAREFPAV